MSDLVERLTTQLADTSISDQCADLLIEAADEITRLRAEVAEWEKLRDPATLHANLLRGVPAALTRAQIVHLVGSDDQLLGELEYLHAEVEALQADAARYRWLRAHPQGSMTTYRLYTKNQLDIVIDAARKNNGLPT